MNTRLTARSCRGIASRLALPKKRSLRPKLPSSKAPTAVDGMGVDGVDAGLQSSTSAVFSRFPFVFFFLPSSGQQLRPPPSFSSCRHQMPTLLYLTPNPTQTPLLHLPSTCPRPPRGQQISAPAPPRRNPPVPEVPDSCHPNQPSEPTLHHKAPVLPTASPCRALGNITPLCLQKSSCLSLSPHQKNKSAKAGQQRTSSFSPRHSPSPTVAMHPPSRRSPA